MRQDEAAAQAREEAEEQRMQEVDSERRIQILRGLEPPPPPSTAEEDDEGRKGDRHSAGQGRSRKRRKLAGEDDTDYAIRVAREDQQSHNRHTADTERQGARRTVGNDAPITDHAGHINLFPAPSSRHHVQKNPEAEAEAARKRREFENQYTMRFSNAAGFKQDIGANPWYSSLKATSTESDKVDVSEGVVGKDVWGNEDPRRKERERMRMDASDPLTAIRQGVQTLRKVERERKVWTEEREREERELKALAELQWREGKRRGKKHYDSDELEDFSLDAPTPAPDAGMEGDTSKRHKRRRHRHRNRSESPEAFRDHSRESIPRKTSEGRDDVRHRQKKPGFHNSRDETFRSSKESKRHARQESERSRDHVYREPYSMLDKVTTNSRPGWEPGSGGRYSSQFATA